MFFWQKLSFPSWTFSLTVKMFFLAKFSSWILSSPQGWIKLNADAYLGNNNLFGISHYLIFFGSRNGESHFAIENLARAYHHHRERKYKSDNLNLVTTLPKGHVLGTPIGTIAAGIGSILRSSIKVNTLFNRGSEGTHNKRWHTLIFPSIYYVSLFH